ncbi:uncharacterized protein LOC119598332 [Penaeus monodon]|uniref:uncharacterized protein LOC119598332 n=1 Tax=Penaeus monodon TaxID=6687 RepID=UPI0018A79A9D|nr:uncharacterized protein LOC119598332 [Penaeus monodon]
MILWQQFRQNIVYSQIKILVVLLSTGGFSSRRSNVLGGVQFWDTQGFSNLVKSESMIPKIYVVPNLNESGSAVLKNQGNTDELCLFFIENVEAQPAKNTTDIRSPSPCKSEEGIKTILFDEASPKKTSSIILSPRSPA